MTAKKLRLVIDTNLWISFLISNSFKDIDELILPGKIEILFSEELLQEFLQVVQKPKLKSFFSKYDVDKLFNLFQGYGKLIAVQSKVSMCRDPDDNFLLALVKDGKADYLLTGDNDLLVLKKFGECKIITYSEFETGM